MCQTFEVFFNSSLTVYKGNFKKVQKKHKKGRFFRTGTGVWAKELFFFVLAQEFEHTEQGSYKCY